MLMTIIQLKNLTQRTNETYGPPASLYIVLDNHERVYPFSSKIWKPFPLVLANIYAILAGKFSSFLLPWLGHNINHISEGYPTTFDSWIKFT